MTFCLGEKMLKFSFESSLKEFIDDMFTGYTFLYPMFTYEVIKPYAKATNTDKVVIIEPESHSLELIWISPIKGGEVIMRCECIGG